MKSTNDTKDKKERNRETKPEASTLGRRDLMKLGAGVVMTTLAGKAALAQDEDAGPAKSGPGTAGSTPPRSQAEGGNPDYSWKKVTAGPGYKNEANRLSGNGPMDDTTRQLVSYVRAFSQADMTDALLPGINTTIIDCMAAIVTGFESEPMRAGAKYARTIQSDMKSTVLGYGIVTSPEAATLATSMGMRDADWVHSCDIVPGILAVGEALHKSGPEVLTAIAVGMEVVTALSRADTARGLATRFDTHYDGPSSALAAGKLLGLDEDRMANALSIAIVPQIPLNVSHTGALSHFKSCHAPWQVRAGISAAIMASHGLTGPAQPFEERGGLWDSVTGPYKELRLPLNPGRLCASEGLEGGGYKRYPTDGDHQAMLDQAVPAIREWTKAEDIESINIWTNHWWENADPPKWDPRNRETADHSMPYVVAYKIIYGDIFLEAFTPKHYIEDMPVRELMNKITVSGAPDFPPGLNRSHFTVRKKSGEEMVKDVYDMRPMTHEDVVKKFIRVCDFKGMAPSQRDQALDTWGNLMKVKDIGDPIRQLAKFGNPMPL
jgi:2-methylcitrate dehydratase